LTPLPKGNSSFERVGLTVGILDPCGDIQPSCWMSGNFLNDVKHPLKDERELESCVLRAKLFANENSQEWSRRVRMLRSDEETRIVVGGSLTFGVCPLVKQMQAVHHLTCERGEASTSEVRAITKYSLGPFVCRLEAEALLIGERLLYVTRCCLNFALLLRPAEAVHVRLPSFERQSPVPGRVAWDRAYLSAHQAASRVTIPVREPGA
jgi:hypothetical protein